MSPTTSVHSPNDIQVSPFECVVASGGELFLLSMINYQDFTYNGSKITFSQGKNVYICATQMARGFNKSPYDWLKTQAAQEYIKAVSAETKISVSELVITRKGGGSVQTTQGTWMHKDVAMEFARWLAPVFGLWCNHRIEELLTAGKTELANYKMPVPTAAVVKNDSITTSAMRVHDKDYSFSEVGRLIKWNGKPMQRRLFVAYLHEHGFLTYIKGCADYPTEMAISLGLLCVVDRRKRGGQAKLIKPRVRVTMDGANYFINLLSHGLRGAMPKKQDNSWFDAIPATSTANS